MYHVGDAGETVELFNQTAGPWGWGLLLMPLISFFGLVPSEVN
jgi:hypothetical protein